MRQTESGHVAIEHVSAHESDKKFQGLTLLQTCFPNVQKWRTYKTGSIPYLSSRIETFRRRIITTNSSNRTCRTRRNYLPPVVVHELDNCTQHIDSVFNDVVNLPTVPSTSPGIGFAASRRKRLLRSCIFYLFNFSHFICILINYLL